MKVNNKINKNQVTIALKIAKNIELKGGVN